MVSTTQNPLFAYTNKAREAALMTGVWATSLRLCTNEKKAFWFRERLEGAAGTTLMILDEAVRVSKANGWSEPARIRAIQRYAQIAFAHANAGSYQDELASEV